LRQTRSVGVTDIRTRVAHPQSDGRLERLHRTHREEALLSEATEGYHAAVDAFSRQANLYNTVRPYTALNYLPPVVFDRGDYEEHRRARESTLARALEARRTFWSTHSSDLEDLDPSHR
jgi:transposase InsO family protein